jgi:hypothetical protein
MPRKVEVVVYEFSELSKKAQDRAIEDFRASEINDDARCLTDIFENDLESHFGLGRLKVFWSLNDSCQGDGVAFEGLVDIKNFVSVDEGAKKFRGVVGKVWAKISHHGSYFRSSSMDVEVGLEEVEVERDLYPEDWDPRVVDDKTLVAFQEYLERRIEEISKELEKTGYAEIEYQNSEEAITETIVANDFEFLENGKRYKQ